ncbi:MAG TPA: MBL fold metallo-hydrolase, partial [Desulfuromonadales bacterium]|nr:MBL fold metallo-hydrolase [Desulfuromonadales bacterium]
TPAGRDSLRRNLDIDRLDYVFITHTHPDHCGLMEELEQAGATVVLSRYDLFDQFSINTGIDSLKNIFSGLGFPQSEIGVLGEILRSFKEKIHLPKRYHVLEEERTLLDELGVDYLACPGHTQSDIVYLVGDQVVTGDSILKGIFQVPLLDVDYHDPGRRFDNYAAYCRSISKLHGLKGRILLPGHREAVSDLAEGLLFYVRKMIERAAVAAPYLRDGCSVYQTVHHLFPSSQIPTPFVKYLKTSEVAFVADFLADPLPLVSALREQGLLPAVFKPLLDLFGPAVFETGSNSKLAQEVE